MPGSTIKELEAEIRAIKDESQKVSARVLAAGNQIKDEANALYARVEGKQSAEEASHLINFSGQCLVDTAASLESLQKTCDEYLKISSR